MKCLISLLVIAVLACAADARPRLFQRSVAKVRVKTVAQAPAVGSGLKAIGGCVNGNCQLPKK